MPQNPKDSFVPDNPDSFVPDSQDNPLIAPETKNPQQSPVGEFLSGAKDVGKGFLSLLNPLESDPESPLGYSTPPERIARGMVHSAGEAVGSAYDVLKNTAQGILSGASQLDPRQAEISAYTGQKPDGMKYFDTAGNRAEDAVANTVDLTGLPGTPTLDALRQGKNARALGLATAGAGLVYGLGKAHAGTEELPTKPTIAPNAAKAIETPFLESQGIIKGKEPLNLPPDTGTPIVKKGLPKDMPVKPLYTTTDKYDINFANDVDKSMWVVSTSQPGPKYNTALQYIMDQTGVSKERAVELSKEFNNYVRLEMKGKESGTHDMPAVYGAVDEPQEMRIPPKEPITANFNSKNPTEWTRETIDDMNEYPDLSKSGEQTIKDVINSPENEQHRKQQIFQWFGENRNTYRDRPWFMAARKMLNDPRFSANEIIQFLQDSGADTRFRNTRLEEPQQMKVPGPTNPDTGTSNVAMGGGSPRVLQVLGSSLYSNDRPTVVVKELLQNALDEHKIAGVSTPVRVLFRESDSSPVGPGKSVTVADNGRGLTPEQIYTIFSDVGETGKAGEVSAAGGFGFAKAAPMLSGDYVRVESVVKTAKGKVRYKFEGNPRELINQAVGVPLERITVPNDTPTGLKVTTYFPDKTYLYRAEDFLKNMVQRSKNISSNVDFKSDYGGSLGVDEWIKTGKLPSHTRIESLAPEPDFPSQGTINLPGADIEIRHENNPKSELTGAELHILNKGLYQASTSIGYGMHPVPNVPGHLVADVVAKVEEGHRDYPFSANREQLNTEITKAINEWVKQNITEGANRRRIKMLQEAYDGMDTMPMPSGIDIPFTDVGGRFTPEDIEAFKNSPQFTDAVTALRVVHNQILDLARALGWDTARLKKFGLLFAAPEKSGTTLGIHIPDPSNLNNSAILINLMEHLQKALYNPDRLSTDLLTTITHEQAHIPGGGHDTNFAYRHAQLMGELGRARTGQLLDILNEGMVENGQLKPELQDLLTRYEESRKRPPSKDDPLLGTGVNREGPPNTGGPKDPNEKGNNGGTPRKPSNIRNLYELSRGLTAAWDISAPFNQGFGMIGTREWFRAWKPMVQSLGSEAAFNKVQSQIERLPVVEDGIAHESGLALMDLSQNLSRREELLKSTWAEKIPGIRASNRAYTAFLNSLRANSFQRLFDAMPDEMKNDPYNQKTLAQFVNDATGRGRHEFGISEGNLQNLPVVGKYLPDKQVGANIRMEKYSTALNDIFFAPRKTSATIRMLNPGTYVTLPPYIRMQYMKSLVRMGVAYVAINQLMRGLGAETTSDPTNSDFGKFKFGDRGSFRVNTPGGFGPFLVLAARLASGRMTSSESGRTTELGKGFKAWTSKDLLEQFGANKLHPSLSWAYDLADASGYKPFNVFDRTLQTFVPMAAQDLSVILKNDPSLLPAMGASVTGMGTQYYQKGTNRNVFVPQENDIQITGSPVRAAFDKMSGQ